MSNNGKKYKCSTCSGLGHNVKNCPENPKNANKDKKPKLTAPGEKTCSTCGQPGHNKTTCYVRNMGVTKR